MKGNKEMLRLLLISLFLSLLSGCTSPVMRPTDEVLKPNNHFAIINFIRPSGGAPAVMFEMWDKENFVGVLTTNSYIQYRASPGEHTFLAFAENYSVIKANLLPGKTYYVKAFVVPGWLKGNVIIVPLQAQDKGDGKEIDDWMTKLKPIAVDPTKRDEYVGTRLDSVRKAIQNVQNGNAKFFVLNPKDGR
jgi:hypothetical protein